jgi:hypothetical protein
MNDDCRFLDEVSPRKFAQSEFGVGLLVSYDVVGVLVEALGGGRTRVHDDLRRGTLMSRERKGKEREGKSRRTVLFFPNNNLVCFEYNTYLSNPAPPSMNVGVSSKKIPSNFALPLTPPSLGSNVSHFLYVAISLKTSFGGVWP